MLLQKVNTKTMKKEKLMVAFNHNTNDVVKHLRDSRSIRMYDRKTKFFYHIQINKKMKRICWERWVSRDNHNWVKWNECITLREVLVLRAKIATNCQEMCFV